jgi:hypothetical protein
MVLNPVLFRALQDRFGRVSVTSRGKAMLVDRHSGRPGPTITQFGECYATVCPFCSSAKLCLSISYRYGEYEPMTGFRNYGLARCFRNDCLASQSHREKLADMIFGLINCSNRMSNGGGQAGGRQDPSPS